MKMSNMLVRLRTAIVFVILFIGLVVGHEYSYLLLMVAIIALSLNEFLTLFSHTREKNRISFWYKPLAITMGVSIFILTYLAAHNIWPYTWPIFLAIAPLSFFIIELWADSANPFRNIAINALGLIYIAFPIGLLNFMAITDGEYNYKIVLSLIFIVWAYDAGAYVFGTKFGKHKLFERVSPGKTWEGSMGGLISALLIAYAVHLVFNPYPLQDWLIIAVIICIFGTFGDLIESMLKRSLNIKDSGTLMPGHGGMLDRFDAVYFMLPFVYLYIKLVVR